MSEHYCEFDCYLNGRIPGVEPCGAPASVRIAGRWYCEDHADSVEAHAELMGALLEAEAQTEEEKEF